MVVTTLRSSYLFPQQFKIGDQETSTPLVNATQLKGHLALLRAFSLLRVKIESLDAEQEIHIQHIPRNKDKRWVWFVGLAVERFASWCESLTPQDASRSLEDFLPPIDVLMIWHTYMLNPAWYHEDCRRLHKLQNLSAVTPIFSSSFSSGLQEILTTNPSPARATFWMSRSARLFDPLEDARRHQTKDIRCPNCRDIVTTPYLSEDGTGYLQHKFSISCSHSSCKLPSNITKPMLGARKFVEDLVRHGCSVEAHLAGSVVRLGRIPEYLKQNEYLLLVMDIRDRIREHPPFNRPGIIGEEEWILKILGHLDYDFENLRRAIPAWKSDDGQSLIRRVLSAYAHGGPFSIDLVSAVMRQGSFVKKMQDLTWIEPAFFDEEENEVVIQHAIARYHAFLDLIAVSPESLRCVPTLDIDLAWHTHQLMGAQYISACEVYVGRIVDHDDKVEEQKLSSAFDEMSRIWNDRFGVPYTDCGCPQPNINQTLIKRLSKLMHKPIIVQTPSWLISPNRSDLRAGTHPSEHDCVVYLADHKHQSEAEQKHRRAKLASQSERGRSKQSKGGSRRDDIKESQDLGRGHGWHTPEPYGHALPFLVPIPLQYHLGAGCAAHSGHVEHGPEGGGIAACMSKTS